MIKLYPATTPGGSKISIVSIANWARGRSHGGAGGDGAAVGRGGKDRRRGQKKDRHQKGAA